MAFRQVLDKGFLILPVNAISVTTSPSTPLEAIALGTELMTFYETKTPGLQQPHCDLESDGGTLLAGETDDDIWVDIISVAKRRDRSTKAYTLCSLTVDTLAPEKLHNVAVAKSREPGPFQHLGSPTVRLPKVFCLEVHGERDRGHPAPLQIRKLGLPRSRSEMTA